jgi:hypothetical protein
VRACSDLDLDPATFVSLSFTSQKQCVLGKVIDFGRSGRSDCCPVQCTVGRNPLVFYGLSSGCWSGVSPAHVTTNLGVAVAIQGSSVGPKDISASARRVCDAMALVCAQVDTYLIPLLGRWRSDVMLRYLHVQAHTVIRNFARLMMQRGQFTLIPGQGVPNFEPPQA